MKCKCGKEIIDRYYTIIWYDYNNNKDEKIILCRTCYSYLEYYNKLSIRVEEDE